MASVVLRFVAAFALAASLIRPLGLKHASLWLALACYASFAWASIRFFRRGARLAPFQRWALLSTYATGLLQALTILYKNQGTLYHVLTALGLYAASLLLFWSAIAAARQPLSLFFSPDQPSRLIRHGPYRRIRHPLYTAYTLAWIAGSLATNQPWLLLTVVANVAIYVHAARLEERQFARTPLAADYASYRRAAGMFWPRPAVSILASLLPTSWRRSAPHPAIDPAHPPHARPDHADRGAVPHALRGDPPREPLLASRSVS